MRSSYLLRARLDERSWMAWTVTLLVVLGCKTVHHKTIMWRTAGELEEWFPSRLNAWRWRWHLVVIENKLLSQEET